MPQEIPAEVEIKEGVSLIIEEAEDAIFTESFEYGDTKEDDKRVRDQLEAARARFKFVKQY